MTLSEVMNNIKNDSKDLIVTYGLKVNDNHTTINEKIFANDRRTLAYYRPFYCESGYTITPVMCTSLYPGHDIKVVYTALFAITISSDYNPYT